MGIGEGAGVCIPCNRALAVQAGMVERSLFMESIELSDQKIVVLQEAVNHVPHFINSLCNIREEDYKLKNIEWLGEVRKINENITSDQLLLFIGPYSSGKSSFINALLGEDLLPTAANPCTSIVTELRFKSGGGHEGRAYKYDANYDGGDYDDLRRIIDGSRGLIAEAAQYHHIELIFDVTQLNDGNNPLVQLESLNIKIVDCPGYGSPYFTDESVIEEYIQKASFTFWLSPADKFGGALAESKLSDIKKKTTALIPVITKADIIDEAQREKVTDDFVEHLGRLFPKQKEPIFVSADKYKEALDLQKKINLSNIRKGDSSLSKEEREKIQLKIEKLSLEAGIGKVLGNMVIAGKKQIVTETKLASALFDLSNLYKDLEKTAVKEEAYWKGELQKKGWTPNDGYKKLDDTKRNVDMWIKTESDMVASKLEVSMTKEILDYIMKVNGKVSNSKASRIIADVWEKTLTPQTRNWAQYLADQYAQAYKTFSIKNQEIPIPDLGSILQGFSDSIMAILEALRYAGVQSTVTATLGAALTLATGAIGSIPLIGGALAWLTMIAGPAIIAVALVPLIPAISDKMKQRKEDARREVEAKLREWVMTLNFSPTIRSLLTEQSDSLYETYKSQFMGGLRPLETNLKKCVKIREEIGDAKNKISIQFPNEFKG
jgi:GTP-binding protein EngB required for normal cell division